MQGPQNDLEASALPHGLKGPVMDPPWGWAVAALALVAACLLLLWWWRRRSFRAGSASTAFEPARDPWAEFETCLLAAAGGSTHAGHASHAGSALCAAIRFDLAKLGVSPALTLEELERGGSPHLSAEVLGALRLGEGIVFAGEVVSPERLSEAALLARQKLTETFGGKA